MKKIREMLQEHLSNIQSKNRSFSLRAFAKYLNISPATLSGFMSGQRNISRATAAKILKKIGGKEEQLLISEDHYDSVEGTGWDQKNFISTWHDFAILSVLEVKHVKQDIRFISNYLGLHQRVVTRSINRLERMKLISPLAKGGWKVTGNKISVGKYGKYDLIRKRHKRELKHFIQVIDYLDQEQIFGLSDLSTMIFACDVKKIHEAKLRIRNFRRRLSRFLESGNKNAVYALGIELLPLSRNF